MSAKANESGSEKMGYIGGESRNQRYLLPEAINDCIGEDNPVRFVDKIYHHFVVLIEKYPAAKLSTDRPSR